VVIQHRAKKFWKILKRSVWRTPVGAWHPGNSAPSLVSRCHTSSLRYGDFGDNCNPVTNTSRRSFSGIRFHRASPRPVAFLGPPAFANGRPLFRGALIAAVSRNVNWLSPIILELDSHSRHDVAQEWLFTNARRSDGVFQGVTEPREPNAPLYCDNLSQPVTTHSYFRGCKTKSKMEPTNLCRITQHGFCWSLR